MLIYLKPEIIVVDPELRRKQEGWTPGVEIA